MYKSRVVTLICFFWCGVALTCPWMWRYVGNVRERLHAPARGMSLVLCTQEDAHYGSQRVIGDLQGAVVEALDIRGAVNVAGLEVDHPSYRNTERLVLAAIPELAYHQECVALANIADIFPQVRSLGLSSALAASCSGSYTS